MEFENKVRLPFFINRPQYPVEESLYVKANGKRIMQNVSISKELQGSTDAMPAVWHERLSVALKHDTVHIASPLFNGYFRMTGALEVEWPEDTPLYPTAQAKFKGHEDGWAANASRCDVCSDEMNLGLQDDTISIEQGQSHTFDVSANDFIGCDDPAFELVSFNATYLDSATISAEGVLSLTVKDSVPTVAHTVIATYRVTCGTATATAIVSGGVTGTGAGLCPMPMNLTHSIDTTGDLPATTITWQAPDPAPTRYFYQVEKVNGGVLVAGAMTDSLTAVLTGQAYSTAYLVRVYGVCQQEGEPDRYSTPVTLTYTTPARTTQPLPHEPQTVYVYGVEVDGEIRAEASMITAVQDAVYVSGTMTNYNGPQDNRYFTLFIPAGQLSGRSDGVFEGGSADDMAFSNVSVYPAQSKAVTNDKIMDLTVSTQDV